jgi:predicted extracellular nuclease
MSRGGYVVLILVLLGACTQHEQAPGLDSLAHLPADSVTELYFSEYVEGSSFNKAVEIFNGTLDTVDLDDYSVEMFFNGSGNAGISVSLSGSLTPGATFVLAHNEASAAVTAAAQQTGGSGWFNGDDAVVLRRGGTIVDVIGQIGLDPGSQWGSDLASTADNTLRREPAVCGGDHEPNDAFAPEAQWEGFAQNTFDGLGTHVTSCEAGAYVDSGSDSEEPGTFHATYEVQGSGDSSPLEGQTVSVRGVVVGDFQTRNELSGFFLQDPSGDGIAATSDGLFVFHRNTDVSVGDLVEVTGEVVEFHGLTELSNVSEVAIKGSHEPLAPLSVTLPLADPSDWERYEGMLVTLSGASGELVATEVYHLGRGGLVMLADERLVQFTQANAPATAGYQAHLRDVARRSILLDDGSLRQNPDPIRYSTTGDELTAHDTLRVGDATAAVTGVVTYSYSGWGDDAYRLHATEPVDFSPANARPQDPPAVDGKLKVASFNVLNFFNGDGQGGGFPTSRGADSEFELERQLDKLVSAIVPMDAEVLGFIEIENDAGPNSALATLVAALNFDAGQGTYDYVDTGVIGGDAIKVALAYQPTKVLPVGRYRVLNSTLDNAHYTLDPRFDDTRNRPALAQTFVEIATGARFTVVVNHLKSKGSSCGGDPDRQDGQGNCNLTREAAATALVEWADTLARESGDPDVVIMGDLNSYAQEDPVRVLLDGGFENPLDGDEWSYVFSGESGTLDYALVSSSLADKVAGSSVWHINADEPSVMDYNEEFKSDRHVELLYAGTPFRSSDHDPVLLGLDLVPSARPR